MTVPSPIDVPGITKIRHADYEYTNVLLIFQRYTTVVYGD